EEAFEIAYRFIGDEDREVFLVVGLNTKNQINSVHRCHIGSVNASIAHPREIYKSLILNNCSSYMVFHLHPSGDITPSTEDISVTRRLKETGQLMGIELLDHIILGGRKFVSLKEKGYV